MKLTLVRLDEAFGIAKELGYAGREDDQKGIREFCGANASRFNLGQDEVDWATVEFDTGKTKTYSFSPVKPATANALTPGTVPEGFEQKLEAAVNDRLKRLGLVDANGQARPAISPEQPRVHVKSMEEAYYEAKVKNGQATFKDYNTAKGAAHWLMANVVGRSWPQFAGYNDPHTKALHNWADHNKIERDAVAFKKGEGGDAFGGKAFASNVYNQGAPLVPLIFMPDIIRLVNQHGAARRLVSPIRMAGPELILPRRTGGLTMYYPAENNAPTQSNITTDNVTLRAKTGMVLTVCSVQSLDDSGIDLADLVYREMALAIASGEDDAFFIGDGTSTYGGMIGIARKMGTAAGTTGYAATGGTTTDAHSLANIWTAIAALPDYARNNLKIACTPQIAELCFSRLATSTGVGGLLRSDVEGGGFTRQFYGIPIFLNNKMNSRNDASSGTHPAGFTAGDDIDFIVGDFSSSTKFGDRVQVELAMDMSRGFDTYSAYFRGVTRFDVTHHDVGTSSVTGPVLAFWQT